GREALEPEATAVVAMHPYVRGREGPEVTLRLRFAHDHVRHALGVLRRNRAGGYLEVDQASHESNGVSVTELLRRTRDRGRRLALSENPERVRKRPVHGHRAIRAHAPQRDGRQGSRGLELLAMIGVPGPEIEDRGHLPRPAIHLVEARPPEVLRVLQPAREVREDEPVAVE